MSSTTEKPTQYCVGFLFSEDGENVILVEKRRPQWMAGYFNGLGGRVEPSEEPGAAMVREGLEEAGVNPEWVQFMRVEYAEKHLYFFAARDQVAYLDARALTDERLFRVPCLVVPSMRIVPNLRWLIPMGRHALFHESFWTSNSIIIRGNGSAVS